MAYYQQNMLSIKSRTILANLLAEITLLAQSIETFREALADVPYFDCISLFRFLDKEEKGYLRQKDFQRAIGTSHRKLLTYAFSWFDNMKVGQISRLEFAAFMLPKDNLELRELVAQRIQHPQISQMHLDTLSIQFSLFRELVLEIIRREMKMIELRRRMIAETDYSVRGALLAIDVDSHVWICSGDILNFMKNYGINVDARQVQKMLEMVNCSMDGKVTEGQLAWIIEGFEGKERDYLDKIKTCNKKAKAKKPVHLQSSLSEHRRRNKSELAKMQKINAHQSQYKSLVKKIRTTEHKQKKIDKLLWQQQAHSVKIITRIREKELAELKFKREVAKSEELRVKQAVSIQNMLNQQFEELMSKASRLQSQTDRLIQRQNRMNAFEDYQLKENQAFYIPKRHNYKFRRPIIEPDTSDVDFMNHPALLRYRKPCLEIGNYQNLFVIDNFTSTKRNDSIKKHLQDSEIYLSRSRAMRDRILQERESQRQIYQSFITKQTGQAKGEGQRHA